jgi:hypothetical protein
MRGARGPRGILVFLKIVDAFLLLKQTVSRVAKSFIKSVDYILHVIFQSIWQDT